MRDEAKSAECVGKRALLAAHLRASRKCETQRERAAGIGRSPAAKLNVTPNRMRQCLVEEEIVFDAARLFSRRWLIYYDTPCTVCVLKIDHFPSTLCGE